jgi:hypothetical protein
MQQVGEDFIAEYGSLPVVAANTRRIRCRAALQCVLLLARTRHPLRSLAYGLKAVSISPWWTLNLFGCYLCRSWKACMAEHPAGKVAAA